MRIATTTVHSGFPRSAHLGALVAVVLWAQVAIPTLAHARGQTSKPDEKRVTRVVRITPPDASYGETHFCVLHAFNQTSDKVTLWGPTGPQWGRVDALTTWKTPVEFAAAVHPIPWWGPLHQPIWSEIPGEADVLYSMNTDSGEVMRIDLTTGKGSIVIKLPGSPSFGKNFFLLGFSSDRKFIVWETPDDPATRGWEVDVVARTARIIPSPPAQWSSDWVRFPFNNHGHYARSPDRTMIIGSGAPDIRGYMSYLQRQGQRSIGLANRPALNHVVWSSSNSWAVLNDIETGSLYQIWTDGTWVKLLDLLTAPGGYYRESSFPNTSRDGRMLLYSSPGGKVGGNIGIFLAFLEDPNASAPVAIQRFEAAPAEIQAGGAPAQLRWSTVNATSVRITSGPGSVGSSGTVSVRPTADTQYELVAEGPEGPVHEQVMVRVHPQPPSGLLPNASLESGATGSVPQGWYSSAGAALTHDEAHDFSGSVRVSSDPASGAQGKIWASVSPADAQKLQGHRVTLSAWVKSAVPRGVRGESIQLHYGVPTRLLLTPIDDVVGSEWKKLETSFVLPLDVNGALSVSIAAAASWEDASVYVDQVSLAVDDTPAPPVVDQFEVAAAPQQPGNTISVAWRVRGATSLVLMPQNIALAPLDQGVLVFGGDYASPQQGSTVRLVAQGPGGSVTRDLALTVGEGAPVTKPVEAPREPQVFQ